MGAQVFFADANELATLTNTFAVDGTPTDPTTVTLTVTDPYGAATPYSWAGGTLTRTGTGAFSKDVACSTAGTWSYLWEGTGVASDAVAGTWEVLPTQLGRLYCTPAALRSRVGLLSTDTSSDFELHAACFSASRWVEQHCDRHFWRTASTEVRSFEPRDGWYLLRLPDYSDLVSVTQLATDPDADGMFDVVWSAADYQLLPVNPQAAPEVRPYTAIKTIGSKTFPALLTPHLYRTNLVQITGVFGWPAVPPLVQMAAAVAAAETFRLKDAPFGVASFGDMGAISVRPNPMAERMLAPYRRNPVLMA